MPVIDLNQILTTDIQQPARYLGKEFGAARKAWSSPAHPRPVRWVLSYPELYEVGASNLGHIILYNLLNAQLDQVCDRVYLPATDLAAKLRQLQLPLFAVESRRPLQEFDLIGFSLAYELGGTNVLEMLDLARIPLTWMERNSLSLADCPFIFAGGPTATSNPEPFADFFDFFALGDGEDLLPEIGQTVAAGLHRSRQDLLMDLAQVPGVYVPQFYGGMPVRPLVPGVPDRILRRVAAPQPEYSVGLVPYVETVHDRLVMEVRRGCTRGCRFCQPGMLTRPARDVDPDQLVQAVSQGLRQTGYDEFSLSSLSCSDYLSLPAVGSQLHSRFRDQHISLSLPSQRVDRFDDQIAQIMQGSRRAGVTFAPEAGTQRLRDIINKGLTDAEMVQGIRTAALQGWDRIKLYFMIGLPGETDEDVVGIARTVEMLQRECAAVGCSRLHFTLTLSNFTPKPHTPFQWYRVDYDELQRKQKLLKRELHRLKGVKGHFTDVRFSILEDLIGKGDRCLSPMIYCAWKAGAGMDSWFENIDQAYSAWIRAYEGGEQPSTRRTQLPIHGFQLPDPLPWDHIDTGIDKAWLQKDYQRALAAMIVPDCSFHGCSACGVCGSEFGHNVALPAAPIPAIPPQPCRNPLEPIPPAQRFRLTYTKEGDLRWLGHLDLMRLWERACRRAGIPLAFTGGFRPTPRLSNANALSLGQISRGEVIDLELIPVQMFGMQQLVTPLHLQTSLQKQLPAEIQIRTVAEIPLSAPSATQVLVAAEYQLTLSAHPQDLPPPDWLGWIETLQNTPQIWIDKISKSGKSYSVDARALLYQLQCVQVQEHQAVLIYQGSCRNDGSILQPKQVVAMLQQVAAPTSLKLEQIERLRLILSE
jgi:radical SAM family uncharacterized protein/radical SAM-linked protein